MSFGDLPFGLREVRLKPYNADGTLGAAVALPNIQTFSFEDKSSFEKLEGDDTIVAIGEKDSTTSWDLEAGGISLEAYAVLSGVSVVTAGVTPNQTKTITKNKDTKLPYFLVEGRAISESGGDIEIRVFKCKASSMPKGELKGGQFYITKCSGDAVPDSTGKVWEMKQKETAAALV